MDYLEQWQHVERQLRNIQQISPLNGYIRDGIVKLDNWRSQSIRPLFIGKEAYGSGEWSITEHCMNQGPVEFCRKSPRSWPKTAHISYALQNGLLEYNAAIRNSVKVSESLRNIAFINVGKHGAAKQTPAQRLAALYKQNRTLLHEQISICQPNIIIGWSTLGLFESDKEFLSRFATGKSAKTVLNGVSSWHANGKLFISATHPSYFKIPAKQYVNNIIKSVKEQIEHIDQSLPVF